MSKTDDNELKVILTTEHIELKPADIEKIEEKANRLPRFFGRLIDCRVKVKGPGQHHTKGGPYQVSLTLGVPGPDLHVTQKTGGTLDEAIRDAFKAAERQLEDYSQKLRGA
jgi:ribosome-associated translation inhibitor RaiA